MLSIFCGLLDLFTLYYCALRTHVSGIQLDGEGVAAVVSIISVAKPDTGPLGLKTWTEPPNQSEVVLVGTTVQDSKHSQRMTFGPFYPISSSKGAGGR